MIREGGKEKRTEAGGTREICKMMLFLPSSDFPPNGTNDLFSRWDFGHDALVMTIKSGTEVR